MKDLNAVDSPSGPHDSFAVKAARFGFAWMIFSIFMVVVCFAQFLIMAFKPIQAVGVDDNGVMRGVVVFNERSSRPMSRVKSDIHQFVGDCTSRNKNTIFVDLASCLAHLSKPLADLRLDEYSTDRPEHKGIIFAKVIEKRGCKRTEIEFDQESETIRYKDGGAVTATLQDIYGDDQDLSISNRDANNWAYSLVSGRIICLHSDGGSLEKAFKIELLSEITNRTKDRPLGLEVHSYEDVK